MSFNLEAAYHDSIPKYTLIDCQLHLERLFCVFSNHSINSGQ